MPLVRSHKRKKPKSKIPIDKKLIPDLMKELEKDTSVKDSGEYYE